MPVDITYSGGVFSAKGRLSIFSHEASVFKTQRSSKRVNQMLAVVADDSGPFPNGDHASEIAISRITKFFQSPFFMEMKSPKKDSQLDLEIELKIKDLISEISTELYTRGIREKQQVRLSLTFVILVEENLYAVHSGNNRILKVTDRTHEQLTLDSSLSSQPMQKDSSRDLKSMNIPILGLDSQVDVQFITDVVTPDDTIALFTDGISEFIPNQEVVVILNSLETHQGACNRLISIAQQRGMRDNATMIAFSVKPMEAGAMSVHDIAEREHERGEGFWGGMYSFIVVALIAVMIAGLYIGFRYAQQVVGNLSMAETQQTVEGVGDLPYSGSGSAFLVKDPESAPLDFFRLNGRSLEIKESRHEIYDSFNNLELLPVMNRGTYAVELKMSSKGKYRVYEGASRNIVQVYQDEVKIYLTKGSAATLAIDEEGGVMYLELTGMGSPMRITFEKQNIILKVLREQ
jgi:PPM family protein phosphatase